MTVTLLDVLEKVNKKWILMVLSASPLAHLADDVPGHVGENAWKDELCQVLKRHGQEDEFLRLCVERNHYDELTVLREQQALECQLHECARKRDLCRVLSRDLRSISGRSEGDDDRESGASNDERLSGEAAIGDQFPWPPPLKEMLERLLLQENDFDYERVRSQVEALRDHSSQGAGRGGHPKFGGLMFRPHEEQGVGAILAGLATEPYRSAARRLLAHLAVTPRPLSRRVLSRLLGQPGDVMDRIVELLCEAGTLDANDSEIRIGAACAQGVLLALSESERYAAFLNVAEHMHPLDLRRVSCLAAGQAWERVIEEALVTAEAYRRDGRLEHVQRCLEYAWEALKRLDLQEPCALDARRAGWVERFLDTLLRMLLYERASPKVRWALAMVEGLTLEGALRHNLLCVVRSFGVDVSMQAAEAHMLLREMTSPMFPDVPMLEVSRLIAAAVLGMTLGCEIGFLEEIVQDLETVAARCAPGSRERGRATGQALNLRSIIENERREYHAAMALAKEAARYSAECDETQERALRLLNAAGYALGLSRLATVTDLASEVDALARRLNLLQLWVRAQLLLVEVAFRERRSLDLAWGQSLLQACQDIGPKECEPMASFAIARMEWTLAREAAPSKDAQRRKVRARSELAKRAAKLYNERSLSAPDLLIRAMAAHGSAEHVVRQRLVLDARMGLTSGSALDPEIHVQILGAVLDGTWGAPRDWIDEFRKLLEDPSVQVWDPSIRRELFSLDELRQILHQHEHLSTFPNVRPQ